MTKHLVSIIIPVYNVSDYIDECLESVVNQSYQDLQVIIVDDCGSDDSMSKIEKFIESYKGPVSFIILHHTSNRGQSAARNSGMDAATGEYIFFLDGDDYIYNYSIEILIRSINQEEGIDWAFGKFETNLEQGVPKPKYGGGIFENVMELRSKRIMYPMPWNYLIRTDFLRNHDLHFFEGLLHEDNLWTFEMACFGEKVALCDDITYFYRKRERNTTSLTFPLRYPHFYAIHKEMIRFVYERNLYNRRDVFDCVSQDIKGYFILAFFNGHGRLSYNYYHIIRENPYLSIRQIWSLTHNMKEIYIRFHRYQPIQIGYLYLWIVYRPLTIKELLHSFYVYLIKHLNRHAN